MPDNPPFYDEEYPQQWSQPPDLGHQHYPVEKVSNPNSSQEPFEEKEVQIFPNPASEAVWVKTKNGEPIRAVSVFNSTGALVLKATPAGNEHQVDVWALPPGAYWVEIALAGRRLIRQWVKE